MDYSRRTMPLKKGTLARILIWTAVGVFLLAVVAAAVFFWLLAAANEASMAGEPGAIPCRGAAPAPP